jgi:hypothetical protein
VIYIYAIHPAGGSQHRHIASVRWKNTDDGGDGQSTRAEMVRWIRDGGSAYVCGDAGHLAKVGVVDGTPPYIRTHVDGYWNDNLLALARY